MTIGRGDGSHDGSHDGPDDGPDDGRDDGRDDGGAAGRAGAPGRGAAGETTPGTRVDGCDLCEAARITPWYHECEICWIAECEICAVPMAVWRFHGTDLPEAHRVHILGALEAVVREHFGFEHYYDDNMRNIPDHYHVHARPQGGFFGHGLRRQLAE